MLLSQQEDGMGRRGCVGEVSTSARLGAALDWLATSGKDARLLGRARIARSLAVQMD
jgi:hypothetical protein